MEERIQIIKRWAGDNADSLFIFCAVFLVSLTVFGIIVLKQQPKFSLKIERLNLADVQSASPSAPVVIVGNKSSKIYHLADCPGALKMSEQNKIVFDSVGAAAAAGYRPAKNCPGLEYLK